MNGRIYTVPVLLLLAGLACGGGATVSTPKAAVSPMSLSGGLTSIDVCQAIPQEDMEALLGRKLVSRPEPFEYYDESGTRGCWYDGGKDASGEAYYGYVVLTPIEVYSNQPLYLNTDVPGIGESAYFNNGADTRQLWVNVNDAVAFVVANGDRANEEGELALARLIVAAIK